MICLSCDCFFESVGKDIIKNAYVNTRIDKKWIKKKPVISYPTDYQLVMF